MIVEIGDIVTVFLACQITIKNVQVQLTVKGNTTPDSYTPIPKSSCAQNVVVLKWSARKTTQREDRLISRRGRQQPFSTAGALRGNLAFGGHISTHTIFGLSDYHQERTSPTYSQRKNNPRQLHPHPQKQLRPKYGCPEMKCFVGAKPLHNRR
jgi:hypothetical protein